MKNCIITKETVQNIIEKRDREIHKGDCGRVLIVAGSEGMAGAAVLSATAALRSGSGLVQIAIPKELFPIVQVGVPEATCLDRDFSKLDLSVYDAVCVGPGLGKSAESVEAVKFLIENYDGKMVMDADALNIVAENDFFEQMRNREARVAEMCASSRTVITPHIGEARRLLGERYDELERAAGNGVRYDELETAASGESNTHSSCGDCEGQVFRIALAQALAMRTGAVSVLKGHATIVATPDGKTYINTTGNPGMATAGSGDVLSGVITGLMGQKYGGGVGRKLYQCANGGFDFLNGDSRFSAMEASLAGVYIHGMAGDLAAEVIGEYGLIAGDIAYYAAIALKEILG